MHPNRGFQEDRSPRGMLVWDGWPAAGPGGCWKETGEVRLLLGVCWIFREGACDGVNVKPRSRHPVRTQLQGSCGVCAWCLLSSWLWAVKD